MGAPSGLVILGAGGHGRSVAAAARSAGWKLIAFFDPRFGEATVSGDWPIEADGNDLSEIGERAVIVGIGENARRLALLDALAAAGFTPVSVVHPRAWVDPGVDLPPGCVIGAMAVVNAGATLGRGTIVNSGAIVEHNCTLAEAVHVAPGAVLAGGVRIGPRTTIGATAAVRQTLTIGANTTIGMGAVVTRDVPDNAIWAGVPARALRRNAR